MSNLFIVDDAKINSTRTVYKLDTDLLTGFKRAVRNNQALLALEYMVHIVDILDERLSTDQETQPDRNPEEAFVIKASATFEATADDSLAPSRKIQKQHQPTPKPKDEPNKEGKAE